MKCVNCEHFKILYKPIRIDGVPVESGRTACSKYDLVCDYVSTRQINRLECTKEKERNKET